MKTQHLKKDFIHFAIYFFILFLLMELFLRLILDKHYSFTNQQSFTLQIKGNDSTMINFEDFKVKNATIEPTFKEKKLSYTETLDNNYFRITKPLTSYINYYKKPIIALLGCSFTNGSFVEDSCTASYLLQNHLKSHNIINAGKGGRGTIEALKQLKYITNIYPGNVKYAIYNYASFQEMRNVKNQLWLNNFKNMSSNTICTINKKTLLDTILYWEKFEFCRLKNNKIDIYTCKNVKEDNNFFNNLYIRNACIKLYGNLELKYKNKEFHEVTCYLLLEMQKVCIQNGIKFIVCGITDDAETNKIYSFCKSNGIHNEKMNIDFGNPKYTFMPVDGHPNLLGHQIMAKRLLNILRENGTFKKQNSN